MKGFDEWYAENYGKLGIETDEEYFRAKRAYNKAIDDCINAVRLELTHGTNWFVEYLESMKKEL